MVRYAHHARFKEFLFLTRARVCVARVHVYAHLDVIDYFSTLQSHLPQWCGSGALKPV